MCVLYVVEGRKEIERREESSQCSRASNFCLSTRPEKPLKMKKVKCKYLLSKQNNEEIDRQKEKNHNI